MLWQNSGNAQINDIKTAKILLEFLTYQNKFI